jgi:hypothetical protein
MGIAKGQFSVVAGPRNHLTERVAISSNLARFALAPLPSFKDLKVPEQLSRSRRN